MVRSSEVSALKLSLPHRVAEAGGIAEWNAAHEDVQIMAHMLGAMCKAQTVEQVLVEVGAIIQFGHLLWAYAYMRTLYVKDVDLFYGALLAAPTKLLPVVYTPTVGEACQKFGLLPMTHRGCYISLRQRGNIKAVLREYAAANLEQREDGTYSCECIVFSDGGRILGLGDLGTWGMGIPIGKLDLYTVCAGVNPHRTIPVILDAGISDANTAKLKIRDHPNYTGMKQQRKMQKSPAGTQVNSCYYGKNSFVEEFMDAAVEVFGRHVLLQYEDFNSNDAFPLLEATRTKYLTYNDDIQGTAAVTVAGILGAMKLREPKATDLLALLREQTFLFHGAGSANVGAALLLMKTAGVSQDKIFMTNSRGLIWRNAEGTEGSYRNDEQKAFAVTGKPGFRHADLVDIIDHVRPSVLVGAVGVAPGCFGKDVIEHLLAAQDAPDDLGGAIARCMPGLAAPKHTVAITSKGRPVVFALSNPKTQAEITASDAYTWSEGGVIYGSGTSFDEVTVGKKTFNPGQVC